MSYLLALKNKFSYDSSCSQVKKGGGGRGIFGVIISIVQRVDLYSGDDMMIPHSRMIKREYSWTEF